jgi:hypothetical protein
MSSADKHSVVTDALQTLGTIIDEHQNRDAIHLAVEPAVAGCLLRPGEHVGLVNGQAVPFGKMLGIVDPFLTKAIESGERFWLVVYPRRITSLRHVWEHPDFPASRETATVPSSKEASEKWLREFVSRSDCPNYETVIAAAVNHEGSDSWDKDFLLFRGRDAHGDIPPEFWTHVEIVTGRTIPPGIRAAHFSCSC